MDNIDKQIFRAGKIDGQYEFPMSTRIGLDTVDTMFQIKRVTMERTISLSGGIQAVFMTNPVLNNPCFSNRHKFSHLLMSKNTMNNSFTDSTAANGISQVARYWLAGLMKHVRGLTALCCPTVNCYRRLHGPSEPWKASASMDINEQNCSFHLKKANTPNRPIYVQNHLPGGSANPYIVLAATVAAGLAGITNKYRLPERDVDVLLPPQSLSEALDALKEDQVLVKALGVDFVRRFISMKHEFEVDVFPGGLTDETIGEEQDMYLKMS